MYMHWGRKNACEKKLCEAREKPHKWLRLAHPSCAGSPRSSMAHDGLAQGMLNVLLVLNLGQGKAAVIMEWPRLFIKVL